MTTAGSSERKTARSPRVRAGIGVVAALCTSLPVVAAGSVRVAGIQVVGAGLGANGSELQAFRSEPGLVLALAVEPPAGKSIIEIDEDECVLRVLADDRGTNLLESVSWGPFPETTEDGRQGLIEVRARTRPARDASRVRAEGTVALLAAAGVETEKIAKLDLSPGRKLQTRRGPLELVEVAGDGGDSGTTLTFGANAKIRDELKDIRFLGADGQPIELWGRGSMTLGNAVQLEYILKEKPASVALELDWWQGLEETSLPFSVDVGLGLTE
jgi:hypothetical protein